MLRKCSSVLLLTNFEPFGQLYSQLAEEMGVSLRVEEEWNERYRVAADVVICGSKYLDSINRAYYPITVVILRSGESPAGYIKEGITRFIFDHENRYELALALYKPEKIYVQQKEMDVKSVLDGSPVLNYEYGAYRFDFSRDRYFYKSKGIYLTKREKTYLAEWLLNGHKDNEKRMCLFNMRKKFGKDFLADIDRFGQLKEDNNEQ